jgi:hypothetical protein
MLEKRSSEKGQALILILMGIFGILALTALAVDGGNAFADRRHAQSAADTAVLAAALAKVNGNDWQTAAATRAEQNGYPINSSRSTVTIVSPPSDGKYSCAEINNTPPSGDACDEYIQVVIQSTIDTWFAPIVGVNTITSRVSAVARAQPKVVEPFFFGHAMVSLNPKQCHSVTVAGNSNTVITSDNGAGIWVNSDCATGDQSDIKPNPQQAFFQNGTGQIIAPSLSSVGGIYYNTAKENFLISSISTIASNPPPHQITSLQINWPQPTCNTATSISGTTMNPGNYDSTTPFPPTGINQLNPGVYCINNASVSINSDLTGEGILLYVKVGSITVNGNAKVDLRAATTGQYSGLLFYMPPSNYSDLTVNGGSEDTFQGMILAPVSRCSFTGEGTTITLKSQIICDTIKVGGTGGVNIEYTNGLNYDGELPPVIELTQ